MSPTTRSVLPAAVALACLVPAVPAAAATAPAQSACRPVAVQSFHGARLEANCRLARVENGSVPCVGVDSARPRRCRFTTGSGRWLRSTSGAMYAMAGQRISRLGAPGGNHVVASPAGKAPCVEDKRPKARRSDLAGTAAGYELAGVCAVEVALSPSNSSGMPLRNYATREVCSTTRNSPDQVNAVYTGSPAPGVHCYRGEGAGLNDPNGSERGRDNHYLTGSGVCHVMWIGGYEVYAAKRPATISFPAPGRVNPNTPIVWRPVSTVPVAN